MATYKKAVCRIHRTMQGTRIISRRLEIVRHGNIEFKGISYQTKKSFSDHLLRFYLALKSDQQEFDVTEIKSFLGFN